VAASTTSKRSKLRVLYGISIRDGKSLYAVLLSEAERLDKITGSGTYISATSAAGRAVQKGLIPGRGPSESEEIISELLDLFDECEAALISADIATPTDAQIFAEMKSRLVPVTEATTDWSGARLGYGTPVTITSA
jgi:hypothetical protein